MSFANIPEELRLLRQWVCWRLEDIGARKATKVPYQVGNNDHASTDDPNSWGTFDDAVMRVKIGNMDGIGFMLSENDPYSFIDLDDPTTLPNGNPNSNYQLDIERQIKIFREFDSYSEVSPSGKGLHIIVRGKVPVGRRRSFIEIYSAKRYATFTGIIHEKNTIENRQNVLMQLWEQMGVAPTTYTFTGNDKEIQNDEQIISQASNAVNGHKFKALLEGNWQDLYPSQSEADFAFVDIVAFYTQNKKQIERIFKASPLGKRDKARRSDYIDRMIMQSFDNQLPQLDFDGFKNALDLKISQAAISPQLALPMDMPKQQTNNNIVIPPGLLGELAQFIYQAAPRPVPEIALAGAIGLLAGICGRAYNISGTGLNQYVLLIADTGSGKEQMASGIDRLMNAIRAQVPTSSAFIGPAEIASGQALVKHLNKTSNCFVSILGEFGLRLQSMSNPQGNSAEIGLRRILLDLYNKSGHGQVFRETIYSDKDKNINATQSPSMTILGESTPEKFYGALNEDMIAEGLLPRFMLIEYIGPRPALNKNHLQAQPSFHLIEKFAGLVANCEIIMHAKKVIDIHASNEADTILDAFDKHCDAQINGTNKDVIRQLWNRAHIKALKTSALIAVGVNMSNPVVMPEYVNWAINMVQSDIRALSARFESGDIGSHSNENKQLDETLRHIKAYFSMGVEKAKSYSVGSAMYEARIIPYAYLNRRLLAASCFRQDRLGATNALKRVIQILIDSDKIREVPRSEMVHRLGTIQKGYMVSDLTILS